MDSVHNTSGPACWPEHMRGKLQRCRGNVADQIIVNVNELSLSDVVRIAFPIGRLTRSPSAKIRPTSAKLGELVSPASGKKLTNT